MNKFSGFINFCRLLIENENLELHHLYDGRVIDHLVNKKG